MNDVNLAAVDLNLLVVLDAVLREGSATRAAARLRVTQSAVSNALGRLRALFGDPLVVRRPRGLEPTPRAAALAPPLRALLDGASRLIAGEGAFDPATTARAFSIACSDAIGVVLFRPLVAALARAMPRARLRVLTLERLLATDGLARGDVDLLIGVPPALPPGCSAERLYDDPMRCVLRAGHPRAARRLSLGDYAALPHVEVALFGAPDEAVDRALARQGLARTVRVAVPHFASVPPVLLETDCVATLSARLARGFARHYPLRVVRPPLDLPSVGVNVVWHRRAERDEGVALLRRLVVEAARRGAAPAGRPRATP
jgi:DNA-binding transcriptional LysR family regulator